MMGERYLRGHPRRSKRSDWTPSFVAENIALQLERRVSFRRGLSEKGAA